MFHLGLAINIISHIVHLLFISLVEELCKLEVPQLPTASTPGSPGGLEPSGSLSPGADDRALGGSVDVAMKTPVLLHPLSLMCYSFQWRVKNLVSGVNC